MENKQGTRRDPRKNPLKVGVLGLGNVGRRHVETYHNHKHCQVKWIFDVNDDLAYQVSAEFGEIAIAKDYQDMVEDRDIDMISICTYDGQHFKQIISALENQKHVFVEKPMCSTLDEVRKVKNAWEKAGRPAFDSNLMSRGSPLYKWLCTFIERDGLGKIYSIDAEYWYGRLHKLTDGWRNNVDDYSVMGGGAIHLMDTMFMMIDERPSSCFAKGNRICTENSKFKYNDYVTATYGFESSLIARITANFGCVHRHQHILRIFGDRATFILDDAGPRIHATRDNITEGLQDKSCAILPIGLEYRPAHKGHLILDLVDQVIHEKDNSTLAQQNFDVMSAVIAADRSVKLKKEIAVDYV